MAGVISRLSLHQSSHPFSQGSCLSGFSERDIFLLTDVSLVFLVKLLYVMFIMLGYDYFLLLLYTALVFNLAKQADNLRNLVLFVLVFVPGEETSRYIDKWNDSVLTLSPVLSLILLLFLFLCPSFLLPVWLLTFVLTLVGTSLLIICVVVMETFMAQVQTQHFDVNNQYGDVLKKANL